MRVFLSAFWLALGVAMLPHEVKAAPKAELWAAWLPAASVSTQAYPSQKPWADLLARYHVDHEDGVARLTYSAVTPSDRQVLKDYLTDMTAASVDAMTREEQFAYWVNLYNALTVDVILDHYPVETIRDISFSFFSFGPWSQKIVTVQGRKVSLDDIEHRILRPIWQDARVHYAVNCASIGCPNLWPEPFDPAQLETQLEAAARAYINHPRGVRVEDGAVIASSIYDWFVADFNGNEAGILAHMRDYATPETLKMLEGYSDIDEYDYDWSLNR